MSLAHSSDQEVASIPTEGQEPPVIRYQPMSAITRRAIIRQVPASFERQYGHARDAHSWRRNITRGEMIAALNALDTETCSAEAINEIIGNKSWTENKCDGCEEDVEAVFRMGEEPDHEARWIDLCPACLASAATYAARLSAQSTPSQPEGDEGNESHD